MRCVIVGLAIVLSAALGFEESFSGVVFPPDNWTWANADSGERNWQQLDREYRTGPGVRSAAATQVVFAALTGSSRRSARSQPGTAFPSGAGLETVCIVRA